MTFYYQEKKFKNFLFILIYLFASRKEFPIRKNPKKMDESKFVYLKKSRTNFIAILSISLIGLAFYCFVVHGLLITLKNKKTTIIFLDEKKKALLFELNKIEKQTRALSENVKKNDQNYMRESTMRGKNWGRHDKMSNEKKLIMREAEIEREFFRLIENKESRCKIECET